MYGKRKKKSHNDHPLSCSANYFCFPKGHKFILSYFNWEKSHPCSNLHLKYNQAHSPWLLKRSMESGWLAPKGICQVLATG